MPKRLAYWTRLFSALGPVGMRDYRAALPRLEKSGAPGETCAIRVPGLAHPVELRCRTSDLDVFQQVFIRQEYACVAGLTNVGQIIDCGANIGLATVVFLNRFPAARLIAVEPDEKNFAMLQRNVAPYGDRVTCVQAGIWSHRARLKVVPGAAGGEWALQVCECAPGETADVDAVSVADLMAEHALDRVDLLKIDIESSEKFVFGPGVEKWLPAVRHLVIELHGPECERAFEEALREYRCERSMSGELTVCNDLTKVMATVSA